MKIRMNKLGIFVITAVIATFVGVGMASADQQSIIGHYAMSGFSSCQLNTSPVTPGNPGIMEADYIFNQNGTGSATQWTSATTGDRYWGTMEFTYTVKDGYIEFSYPNGGFTIYLPDQTTELFQLTAAMSHGYISPDGKTMTISCGPPHIAFIEGTTIQVNCTTSLVGMRLN